jgi:hypothetical protein
MRNYFRPVPGGLAVSDDLLDTSTDGHESDAELADDRRPRDDRDLGPIIGVIVAVGLSLPFWWMLIWVLL